MLPRLTVLTLMYIYLLCCLSLGNVGDRGFSKKSPLRKRSRWKRANRIRREIMTGNQYIWNDDNGVYTPRPQLDTDIVYGVVKPAPPFYPIYKRRYVQEEPEDETGIIKSTYKHPSGAKTSIKKQIRSGKQKITISHKNRQGTRISKKTISQEKPQLQPIYRVGYQPPPEKQRKIVRKQVTLINNDKGGQHVKQKVMTVREQKPKRARFSTNPDERGLVKMRVQSNNQGTRTQYTGLNGSQRERLTIVKGIRNGKPVMHRKLEYDTPDHREQIDEDIKNDGVGNIIVSKRRRIQSRVDQPPYQMRRVMTSQADADSGMVQIPRSALEKLDKDVLNGNQYSRESAQIGKKVLSQKFFKALYNLTYNSAEQALRNQQSEEIAASRNKGQVKWTSWNYWSHCSTSCGPGVSYRSRQCLWAAKQTTCKGRPLQTRACNYRLCNANGVWSEWSKWTRCSASCGIGMKRRLRACADADTRVVALNCPGNATDIINCFLHPCKITFSGRMVFVTEGDDAKLLCNHDSTYKVVSVNWITPSGETVDKGSDNRRYGINGFRLTVARAQKGDSGIYTCVVNTVKHGYVSAQASMLVIDCMSHPCHNGGICVEQKTDVAIPYSTFICQCSTGYYGRRCQYGIGPGGIAAIVIAVIAAILLIIIVVLLCNHRNAQRITEMTDDEFGLIKRESSKRSGDKRSVSFTDYPSKKFEIQQRKTQSDDILMTQQVPTNMEPPTREDLRRMKEEIDTSNDEARTTDSDRVSDTADEYERKFEKNQTENNNDELYLVGQKEILGIKGQDSRLKSMISESPVIKTSSKHSVTFFDQKTSGDPRKSIVSPPLQFSDTHLHSEHL